VGLLLKIADKSVTDTVVTLVSQQGFGDKNENSCFACVIVRPTQPRN